MSAGPPERPWLGLYEEGQPSSIAPAQATALEMFRDSVVMRPSAAALRYFEARIDFVELDLLSDAFAQALRASGVGRGDRFAIHLQNVPQFPIALLAVWKLGAVAVAASPLLRSHELAALLRDCGAAGILSLEGLWHEAAAAAVAESGVAIAFTTSELEYLEGAPPLLHGVGRRRCPGAEDMATALEAHRGEVPPAAPLGPDDVAVLTYTSGTTGPSKGAMNLHRNLVFNAHTYSRWIGIGEEDAILALAPLFHVTGLVAHLALGMLSGAPLVLGARFDAGTMLDLIERHRVSFTVGAITAFVALGEEQERHPRDVSSLTKVSSGGAPIPPALAARFEAQFGAYMHNNYGLTETTSPSHLVPQGSRAPVDPGSGALSVGVPVFDTEARILGEGGEQLATGEIGEIVIRGPQVVPGYWRRPEETAHAFVAGALRTGDVGFMDAQGWFYLVDRRKDLINASGFKVWPREVEDALAAHPAVREVAVVGVPDEYRGEAVKAFVVPRDPAAADAEALIAFGRERLAAYKYPRQIAFLEQLPRTASGKVLRRALREIPDDEKKAS